MCMALGASPSTSKTSKETRVSALCTRVLLKCRPLKSQNKSGVPAPQHYGCQFSEPSRSFCKNSSCESFTRSTPLSHSHPSLFSSLTRICMHSLWPGTCDSVSTVSSVRFSVHHKEHTNSWHLTLYTTRSLALRKHYLVFLL